ncbi:MAG: hypothetical protein V1774_05700 [Candidatus Eisenbacteria bacterium]
MTMSFRALACAVVWVALAGTPSGRAMNHPRLDGAPTIRLGYGTADVALEEAAIGFAEPPMVEFGIGSHTIESLRSGVVSQELGELQISRVSTDLGDEAESGRIDPDAWRFGLNWTTGYGYPWGKARFILNHTSGLAFTNINVDLEGLSPEDQHLLGDFDEKLRFGTHAAAGLLVQIGPIIGVEAQYERALAFRRLLFWKWLGSELIQQGGQSLIDRFVDRILERRPMAAPVVSFLLRSGLSYAAYELRREEMNYPFESAPPLTFDTFKVGLRFTF